MYTLFESSQQYEDWRGLSTKQFIVVYCNAYRGSKHENKGTLQMALYMKCHVCLNNINNMML